MTTLYAGAFAKINLTLDVQNKREDGYHNIKSIMQTISIRDDIEIDLETGKITPIDYVACVDCGTVVNTNLARIQTEGGLVQGMGMALYEDMQYSDKGNLRTRNFMQYKIPTRIDMGQIRVDFEASYEPSGPFGAKSIGEVVINTPAPAIADAVYNGTGLRFRNMPITAEKVFMGLQKK